MSVSIDAYIPRGNVYIPGSKSYTQRAMAAALLSGGESVIVNPSRSEDALHVLDLIQRLGAVSEDGVAGIRISGGLSPKWDELDCGESGLAMRLFTPIAALHSSSLNLLAGGTLKNRPADMMAGPLRELGAVCETTEGFPPVRVKGPLKGGEALVDGSLSSQFLSGLLMALPLAEKDSVLEVKNLRSKPYVDMTMEVLEVFGIEVKNEFYSCFRIPGNQRYSPATFRVEGDWSGAAFFLVAGALAGPVVVGGLDPLSKQADRAILQILEKTGARLEVSGLRIQSEKGDLRAFEFDATDCPDLFPPLIPLAAHAEGTSRIKGVHRLFAKESNRALVLRDEFARLGVEIRIEDDIMMVKGNDLRAGEIDPHGDHRIAMAAAIMAAGKAQRVIIKNEDCVAKSYPTYYDDIKRIGGQLK